MLVRLADGREVDNASEEWRHETEAREILRWPLGRRRAFLYGTTDDNGKRVPGVHQMRGAAEVKRLEDTLTRLWEAKKAAG